ncbi:hypothetical protein PVK06_037684 [Gossypium arboreum]|uniref:DUF4283 domain-containing protein n=1 Tax=Gossypium arboreum TaxID=29729 RepID=A0ABR0MY16_GOSAR|nr:hypothetical protein PVK06_037684 [Gossypium arboreum]
MVWVQLPGLSGYLHKQRILEEIGSLIGTDVATIASSEKNKVAELTKAFGPWMLVEQKSRRNPMPRQNLDKETTKNDVVILNEIKITKEMALVADL